MTVPTAWNKQQAELLRYIALAGGRYPLDGCQGPALDALIAVGFARLEGNDSVALTDAGLTRARELSRR